MSRPPAKFVSRAGAKLEHALDAFGMDPTGWTCADLGCNVGGFTDCLLQRGAARVYAVDTGYGALAWKLRKDPRVIAMERTNAMHVTLPEVVDLVTIDVAWTRQQKVLPAAAALLKPGGRIVSLVKPHYEADRAWLVRGLLPAERVDEVVEQVVAGLRLSGLESTARTDSPLTGASGGNREVLLCLRRTDG